MRVIIDTRIIVDALQSHKPLITGTPRATGFLDRPSHWHSQRLSLYRKRRPEF